MTISSRQSPAAAGTQVEPVVSAATKMNRRDLLKVSGFGVLAGPLAPVLGAPEPSLSASPTELERLHDEIMAINALHFEDDDACDEAADRQTEMLERAVRTPALTLRDCLAKARLAAWMAADGKMHPDELEPAYTLIVDLERLVAGERT